MSRRRAAILDGLREYAQAILLNNSERVAAGHPDRAFPELSARYAEQARRAAVMASRGYGFQRCFQ